MILLVLIFEDLLCESRNHGWRSKNLWASSKTWRAYGRERSSTRANTNGNAATVAVRWRRRQTPSSAAATPNLYAWSVNILISYHIISCCCQSATFFIFRTKVTSLSFVFLYQYALTFIYFYLLYNSNSICIYMIPALCSIPSIWIDSADWFAGLLCSTAYKKIYYCSNIKKCSYDTEERIRISLPREWRRANTCRKTTLPMVLWEVTYYRNIQQFNTWKNLDLLGWFILDRR